MNIEIEEFSNDNGEWYIIKINNEYIKDVSNQKALFYKDEVHTIVQKHLYKNEFLQDYRADYTELKN